MTSKTLRRQILGICTLLLFGVFLVMYCVSSKSGRLQHASESFFRLAIFLGVAWLAWNDLVRIPKWLYILAPIIVISILVFPKATPILLLILAPIWFFLRFLRFICQPLAPQQNSSRKKNPPPKK
ncbi:MAG: hypothetical protein LBT05_04095 [Planctomycetaceae bacterium]|nr:hypothetical protein [Planctomycetaceae bacterium]